MSDIKHTPEPWRWEINLKHKSVQIVGGRPMYDKTVMDFERWGLQGASPRFNEKIAGDEFNVMTRLCDRPDWIAPFERRSHHADWCANVTHPDARRIVACVNACAGIKTEDLEAMRETSILAKANTWADGIAKQRDELLAALGTQAAKDVIAERQRQINVEGWTPEHDDHHSRRELSAAAECYAGASGKHDECPAIWPWDKSWWKPRNYRRNLVKAAALLIAEIERIDRSAIASVNGYAA